MTHDILIEPNKYEILCQIEGNPKPRIKWLKDGRIIAKQSKLIIDTSDLSSTGLYECISDNSLGTTKKEIYIEIYHKPEIIIHNQDIDVNENEYHEIKCPIQGYKLEYTWVNYASEIIPKSWIHNDILKIPKIKKSHHGNWKCKALNLAGYKIVDINLNVLYKPEDISVTWTSVNELTSDIILQKNNVLHMKCKADGNPKPNIFWMKNNSMNSSTSSQLYIKSLNFDDAGSYKCVAKNKIGENFKEYNLYIHSKPEFSDKRIFKIAHGKRKVIEPNMISILDSIFCKYTEYNDLSITFYNHTILFFFLFF